jgi:hypothetical protein
VSHPFLSLLVLLRVDWYRPLEVQMGDDGSVTAWAAERDGEIELGAPRARVGPMRSPVPWAHLPRDRGLDRSSGRRTALPPAPRCPRRERRMWWPGEQDARRLCDDGVGRRAAVTVQQRHDYGRGRHLTSVRPEQVRLP